MVRDLDVHPSTRAPFLSDGPRIDLVLGHLPDADLGGDRGLGQVGQKLPLVILRGEKRYVKTIELTARPKR